MAGGYLDDEKLKRSLRRLNETLSGACALELACAPALRRCRRGRQGRTEEDLVLLGVHRSGAVAVVPVRQAGTRRERLLSLSGSIAECAMLLGLGTSLYAAAAPE